ncbi:MAG: helix-turn-helix domain-containing protein, partial [Marmoricola sp.]
MSTTSPGVQQLDAAEADDVFAVRRNNRLAAVLGVVSSALAIAYLERATDGGVVDVLATLLFGFIGISQLLAVLDARIPLLTADDSGVRIRLGREWLGLPWSTIEQVVVEHRDGPMRDGRLVVVPRNLGNALEALPQASRRAVTWQRRLHGAPLAVPLSISTRNVGVAGSVAETLTRLAADRAEIVLVRGRERAQLDPAPERAALVDAPLMDPADAEPTVVVAYRKPVAAGVAAPVLAVRAARPVFRSDVVREKSRPMPGVANAMRDAAADAITPINTPRAEVLWAPSGGVVPSERANAREVADPIVGVLVRQARERAGLTVDELAERTTIRPHVLEGIEVDDFTACGGDFYARGHLRTLARFLGLNPGDLVAKYDEHYARAPISARRVFEAELATSLGSGVRVRSGGPRWSLIAAAVLALLMVWGAARFLAPQAAPVNSATLAGDSAGSSQKTP